MESDLLKKLLVISLLGNVLLALAAGVYWRRSQPTGPDIAPLDLMSWRSNQPKDFFATMPIQEGSTVLFGDSLTAYGPWGELFGNVLNRGVSHDEVPDLLERLPEVLERKPRRLSLMVGINDLANGVPPAEVLDGIEEILDELQAKSPATQLYVMSILPIDFDRFPGFKNGAAELPKLNARLAEACGERGIPFLDLTSHYADARGYMQSELSPDGVHLRPASYLPWFKDLQAAMAKREAELSGDSSAASAEKAAPDAAAAPAPDAL